MKELIQMLSLKLLIFENVTIAWGIVSRGEPQEQMPRERNYHRLAQSMLGHQQ